MNVYLLRSPEYPKSDYLEIIELLTTFDGPLKFIGTNYEFDRSKFYFLQYELYPHHNFKYQSNEAKIPFDPNRTKPLSWRELFILCDDYRSKFRIDDNSFVMVLTKRKNSLNWFSAFDFEDNPKNVFIQTSDWELYTDKNPKYPIAYEVAANVLRSLMNLPLYLPNDYVHQESKGCFNDLCLEKKEVIFKLKTADICMDCIKKILSESVDTQILNQAIQMFEDIRKQLIFRQRNDIITPKPGPIVVTQNNKIILPDIGNLEIPLTPLFKTLYIFYLQHLEGVKMVDLMDYKKELLSIYKRLTNSSSNQKIEKRINGLIDPTEGSFSQKKSKINKKITELLGEQLAQFYRIEGQRGDAFKIHMPSDLIDIRY